MIQTTDKKSSLEGNLAQPAQLTDDVIEEKIEIAIEAISKVNKIQLAPFGDLKSITTDLSKNGRKAFDALRQGDANAFTDHILTGALEVIVKLDGTRPSFLIKDGKVDKTTNALGNWEDTLDASNDMLFRMIGSVGRIGLFSNGWPYSGTGFLIQQDIIVTNLHVLQSIAQFEVTSKKWTLNPNATINFGCEFEGTKSFPERKITSVIFASGDNTKINYHNTLDMAILSLEPSSEEFEFFNLSAEAPVIGSAIFALGYPGPPLPGTYDQTLLDAIFKDTYGYKRLAPGMINDAFDALPDWTFAHDATTIYGSSGSVILVPGEEDQAIGLHYGGLKDAVIENYAHSLYNIEGTDITTGNKIQDVLTSLGS